MPRKVKNIVFINQTLGYGGAEVFQRDLFSWFNDKNIDISIFSTSQRFLKQLPFASKTKKIPIVIDIIGDWKGFLKGMLLFPFAFIYYGYLVWSTKNVDIIIIGGYIEKVLASPWAKLFGKKVVWIDYGPLSNILSKFFGVPRFLYKMVLDIPEYVIVPSINTKKDLVNKIGVDKNKIIVIPCAVNIPKTKNKLIKNRVCCVSRLQEGKGQDMLIKAWENVIKYVPDATLYIVGEGNAYKNTLQELVDSLKLKESVVFTGWVAKSTEYIAESEVSIFPSIWEMEGFGLVTIESMALGKPVVAFDTGPTPEILINNKTGLLVKKGDSDKMSKAIISLLLNKHMAANLGKAAKTKYLTDYTFDKVGRLYLDIFNKL